MDDAEPALLGQRDRQRALGDGVHRCREQRDLGSTGLGRGIAIPHCRLEELDKIYVAMLKLEEGVDFESTDEKAVTFLFCMVVPDNSDNDHLQLLANLAELLDNENVRSSIEQCNDAKCIHQILCQNPKNLAA